MKQLVFATTNLGKLKELKQLIADSLSILSAAEVSGVGEVEEDQPTFEANAVKKARAYAAATGLPALADDSGLCVDALNGGPGVQSARYAADDAARIQKLLAAMRQVPEPKRGAEFRCALALVIPGRDEAVIEVGACRGSIVTEPRGAQGFGYDPVFMIPTMNKTFAELTAEQKNTLSHRAQAFRKMKGHLTKLAND